MFQSLKIITFEDFDLFKLETANQQLAKLLSNIIIVALPILALPQAGAELGLAELQLAQVFFYSISKFWPSLRVSPFYWNIFEAGVGSQKYLGFYS